MSELSRISEILTVDLGIMQRALDYDRPPYKKEWNMNTVVIEGRFGQDHTLRHTGTGKAVLSATMAVRHGYGDKEQTYWIPVNFWEKRAEYVANNTGKGTRVVVKGRLQVRDFTDKKDNKRTVVEVVADEVVVCDKPKTVAAQNNVSAADDNSIPF